MAIKIVSLLTSHLSLPTFMALMPKWLFAQPETTGKLDPRTDKNEGPKP
jgi:hypothetical protein